MKLALSAEGGLVTVTVCCEVAICCGVLLSSTDSETVYVPADKYVWATDAPAPVDPSPNDQLNP